MTSRESRARIRVLFNRSSGSAAELEVLRPVWERAGAEFCGTDDPDGPEAAARRAAQGLRTQDVLVAAGGDGTVSLVAAVLADLDPQGEVPSLAVLPLGTGNDFARTLGYPAAAEEVNPDLITSWQARPSDVLRWTVRDEDGQTRGGWMINVAAGGVAARINAATTKELKARWGPLAYARSSLSVLGDLQEHKVTFRVDGKPPRTVTALNVTVGNGRFAGGGTAVAPEASPWDGKLDLVLLHPGNTLDMVGFVSRLVRGKTLESDLCLHTRARRLEVKAEPAIPFNIDGEFVGSGAFTFRVHPGRVRLRVPPDV